MTLRMKATAGISLAVLLETLLICFKPCVSLPPNFSFMGEVSGEIDLTDVNPCNYCFICNKA